MHDEMTPCRHGSTVTWLSWLLVIAKNYRGFDEAACKGALEVLALLIGMEQAAREQRALERRMVTRLPKPKTLAEYDFKFPSESPSADDRGCSTATSSSNTAKSVPIGPTGTGKSHLHGRSVTRAGRAWLFGSLHTCRGHDQSSHCGSDGH